MPGHLYLYLYLYIYIYIYILYPLALEHGLLKNHPFIIYRYFCHWNLHLSPSSSGFSRHVWWHRRVHMPPRGRIRRVMQIFCSPPSCRGSPSPKPSWKPAGQNLRQRMSCWYSWSVPTRNSTRQLNPPPTGWRNIDPPKPKPWQEGCSTHGINLV